MPKTSPDGPVILNTLMSVWLELLNYVELIYYSSFFTLIRHALIMFPIKLLYNWYWRRIHYAFMHECWSFIVIYIYIYNISNVDLLKIIVIYMWST